MRPRRWIWLGVLLLAGSVHAQSDAAGAVKPDKHKLSYAIGYQIGSQFAGGQPDVDLDTVQKAIRDAYARQQPAVSLQEMHAQLLGLERRMHAQAVSEFKRIAQENARRSAAFLARHASEPGVMKLPSGIEYRVLKKGSGTASPGVHSTVTVNYRGMLIDGTEFDSSWAHGAPVTFRVDNVIRGWQDVIPRMHVGDRWHVVIPPRLAYGENGQLPRIGPNEALVFEIELLDVKP